MSQLKKLVLTEHNQAKAKVDPKIRSRQKFIEALKQQISIADAQAKGEEFTVEKLRWKTAEDGSREQVKKQIVPRPWFWEENGIVFLSPKIGFSPLELETGKQTIKVGAKKELTTVLNTLVQAAEAGELDVQIKATNSRKR